jgi:RHS repeat-associated protein
MKQLIIALSLIFVLTSALKSQDNIDLVIENQVISEPLEVQAGRSITIKPNTIILASSNFKASINQELLYGSNLDDNENFINVEIFKNEVKEDQLKSVDPSDIIGQVSYFNGNGQTTQQILMNGSPTATDIIQHFEYDKNGFQKKQYLPFSNNDHFRGDFINPSEAVAGIKEYYSEVNGENTFVYSEVEIEDNPLGQITEISAPGETWKLGGGHTTRFNRSFNNSNEVKVWKLDDSGMLTDDAFYNVGELSRLTVTDENNSITKIFKNGKGQVVLKQSYYTNDLGNQDVLETYYVYNSYNMLVCIIPPKAVKQINTEGINAKTQKQIYKFYYNIRKKISVIKRPNMDSIYYVYDQRDRLVLTQDGNLRLNNKWIFIKYDELDRPIINGIYTHGIALNQMEMQTYFNGLTGFDLYETYSDTKDAFQFYTNNAFPDIHLANVEGLSVVYYDNYKFSTDLKYSFINEPGMVVKKSERVRGKITGSMFKILNDTQEEWIKTVRYYSERGENIQTVSNNHIGGFDVITNQFDFSGKLQKSKSTHKSTFYASLVAYNDYEYDHVGRLLKEYLTIEGDSEGKKLISSYEYDALGNLITKKTHATNATETNFLQETDYDYNIRGWLTQVNDINSDPTNDKLFSMQLFYEDGLSDLNGTAQFNGNISGMIWRTPENDLKEDDNKQGYGFRYDELNRIKSADYAVNSGTSWDSENRYGLTNMQYDANGNIIKLERRGVVNTLTDASGNETIVFGVMDALTYSYAGDQLIGLTDDVADYVDGIGFFDGLAGDISDENNEASWEYNYDPNGNMIADKNKGIENIEYNFLNLPEVISFGSGDYIVNMYNSMGVKIRKEVYHKNNLMNTFDYIGGIMYKDNTLSQIQTGQGRLIPIDGTSNFEHQYYLKDHLGNNRIVYKDNGSGVAEVVQEIHYYPFGMTMAGLNFVSGTENKFKFGAKELNDEFYLNWYDFGARMYDPEIGRWHVADPMALLGPELSPYNYVFNNPVNVTDPTGLWPWEDGGNEDPDPDDNRDEPDQRPWDEGQGIDVTFDFRDYYNPPKLEPMDITIDVDLPEPDIDIDSPDTPTDDIDFDFEDNYDNAEFEDGDLDYHSEFDYDQNYEYDGYEGRPEDAQSGGNGDWDYSAFVKASGSLVVLADDWTGIGVADDVVIPVAYIAAAAVFVTKNWDNIVDIVSGNPNYPGPWSNHTEEPWKEIKGFDNESYLQPGSYPPNWIWWIIGGAAAYELYDNWQVPEILPEPPQNNCPVIGPYTP